MSVEQTLLLNLTRLMLREDATITVAWDRVATEFFESLMAFVARPMLTTLQVVKLATGKSLSLIQVPI